MKTVQLKIAPDGTINVQGFQEGKTEEVEKAFKWLLGGLGDITSRGHKHTHKGEEAVEIKVGA